jgi:hypothetical protein
LGRQCTAESRRLATYLAQRDSEFLPGLQPLRLAGQEGFPHWRANAHIDAAWPVWRIGYSLQFIGAEPVRL